MKKIGIYLCALWACGLMACSDDNEIGYVEPWEDEYVLPQGKSDADDRIVAFYEQYNRLVTKIQWIGHCVFAQKTNAKFVRMANRFCGLTGELTRTIGRFIMNCTKNAL